MSADAKSWGIAAGVLLAASLSLPAQGQDKAQETIRNNDGWHFSGDFGLPQADGGETSLAIDAQLGYGGDGWGAGGEFDLYNYSYVSEQIFALTSRTTFGADGWYDLGKWNGYDLETRVELGVVSFATTYDANDSDPNTSNFDVSSTSEFSNQTRAVLLGGLKSPEKNKLSYAVFGGVGVQAESYFQNSDSSSGDSSDDDQSSFSSSTLLLLRGLTTYTWMPGLLTLRGEVEFVTYNIQRSQFVFGVDEGDTSGDDPFDSIEELRGIDVKSRVYGDFDVAAFFGLKPGIFVGADYFSLSGDKESTSSFVPIGGVGFISVQ